MSRSGVSCTTCIAREKRCDGIQPICRRCTRDRVECAGYPSSKYPVRGVSTRKPRPAPMIDVISPPTPTSTRYYRGHSWASNLSSSEPGTPSDLSIADEPISSPAPYAIPTEEPILPSLDPLLVRNLQPSDPSVSISRQAPAPPYYPTDIGPFDEVTRTFLPRKKDLRESMTPGQASLFDALFSLARPEDQVEFSGRSSFVELPSLGPTTEELSFDTRYGAGISQTAEYHDLGLEDSQDAQEVGANLCDSLALDRKVKSNTLPFIIQSYALWIQGFLFEPIRIIPRAKDYIFGEYSEGPQARWRMVAMSNAVRAITGSAGYTLEDMEQLQSNMYPVLATTTSKFGIDPTTDKLEALDAMSTTYEFISVSVKVFPLSQVIKTMRIVAPIFRKACPDPEDRPVNLPSLLSTINIPFEYYATLDVILGVALNRPMNFRYDTAFPPGVYESVFNLEDGPGIRWAYGIPDRLVVTLARMNALLEDFGPGIDPKVTKELEIELKEMKTFAVTSADPSLGVGRLVVQECWRQAAYIYLYMGLCGANSSDARVVKAQGNFMELFIRTKPGRIPDSFLVLPLPILGIATRHPDDQQLLKRRMLTLPECFRKNTVGNQFIRMLDCIWGLANESGRPTTWSDLRLASLYVAGV
ncbi:unnamed protein product [Rhizoctonia solani]|uniref:Zn(2)-C6 fungal-type domain-containing protein n=1 Tax=Rhizoctonia solani TaxID=456999 RepID=A0A8H2XHA9_9AGAM|nr:unnamed protein product [Rhizoctonia solani]